MQVILLERIGKLGQMGDVVTVKDGYARNFLLPQGKALRATAANKERFESERAQLEAHNLEQKKEADAVAAKMDGESFVVIRQAGDTGQLYGSVSTRDIADNVTAAGFEIERRQVLLDRPIKILGLHPVRVALHPEVEVTVTVNVARSDDEAERQARGEDVTALAEEEAVEEEEAISVEEVFEDKELAKEVEETLKEEELEAAAGEEAVAAESEGEEEASPVAEDERQRGDGEDDKSVKKDA
jgi:large subunit ribosomal protein L9